MTRDLLTAIVVGTGFGCRVHVPALRAAGFTVSGLVGTDSQRLAKRAASTGVARTFTDLGEAIAATNAGVVTIATPPSSHLALALTAIEHGCHVICEKPMAMDGGEARTLMQAAERAGVIGLIGNEFRFLPERAMIGRAIAEGAIGKPRFLTLVQYTGLAADPAARLPRWWFDAPTGGGWLGASGSHLIDQIISWLGRFDTLSAALPVVSDRENVPEDSYVLRFRMQNGTEGVVQQTGGAWGPSATMWRVAGTHGTVWAENGIVRVAEKSGVRELKVPEDLALPPLPDLGDIDASRNFLHLELGPYMRLTQALRALIEGRDPQTPIAPATFRDGVAAMQVLDAIRLSAARGGELVQVRA